MTKKVEAEKVVEVVRSQCDHMKSAKLIAGTEECALAPSSPPLGAVYLLIPRQTDGKGEHQPGTHMRGSTFSSAIHSLSKLEQII